MSLKSRSTRPSLAAVVACRRLALAVALALPFAHPSAGAKEPRAGATPARCAGRSGVELEACARCEGQGKSAFAEHACKEGVRIAYCAKRMLKDDPDCRVSRGAPGNL